MRYILIGLILCGIELVTSDYPPPSADEHGYYSHGLFDKNPDERPTDWSNPYSVRSSLNAPRCLNIPSNLTLCRGVGYDSMSVPNLLGHESLQEITEQSNSWVPLVNVKCHPDSQVFLCSLYAPLCHDIPIPPCKEFCRSVQAGCEDTMLTYGFSWPDMLKCDKFPSNTNGDLCIDGAREKRTEVNSKKECKACSKVESLHSLANISCESDIVMKIAVRRVAVSGKHVVIETGKRKLYSMRDGLDKKSSRRLELILANATQCECLDLETATKSLSKTTDSEPVYLVMASRVNDSLAINHMERLDRKTKVMTKLLRKLRKDVALCDEVKVTGEETKKNKNNKRKEKLERGKKKKNQRNKRRRKKKRVMKKQIIF